MAHVAILEKEFPEKPRWELAALVKATQCISFELIKKIYLSFL